MGRVARTGVAELHQRLEAGAPTDERRARGLARGMGSGIIAPMRAGERIHGVISVVTSDSRRALNRGDLAFVEDLALRAGAAVENARLYDEQAHAAQTLQDSLLPSRLPELAGFRTASS